MCISQTSMGKRAHISHDVRMAIPVAFPRRGAEVACPGCSRRSVSVPRPPASRVPAGVLLPGLGD